MPGRRPEKKGSFGGHFDELVKHFPHEEPSPKKNGSKEPRESGDDQSVHDRLFESSWRHAREEAQRSRFSNQ